MCSNCLAPEGCDCTGGSLYASCQCEDGVACPVCKHEPATSAESQAVLVTEVVSTEITEVE